MREPSLVEVAGEGDFRIQMKKAMMWIMMAGALLAFYPGLGDPYIMTKILSVSVPCLVLCLMKGRGSSTEPIVLFCIFVACACALLSVDISYALVGSRLHPFDSLLAMFGLFAVLCAASRSEVSLDSLAKTICAVSIPMIFYAFYQRLVGNNDPLIPLGASIPYGMRVLSTQGSPLYLGACLAVAMTCAAHLMKSMSVLGAVTMACAIPAMWFTQTRGAMLAAGVGVSLVFGWYRIILLAPIALLARSAFQSDLGRIEVWKISMSAFAEHPIVGWGPGNFYLAFRKHQSWGMIEAAGSSMVSQAHAHNEILNVLVNGGLFGLLAYSCLWAWIAFEILLMKDEKRSLMAGACAAFLLLSMFNPVPYSAMVLIAAMLGASTARMNSGKMIPSLAALGVMLLSAQLCVAEKYYADAVKHIRSGDVVGEAAAFTEAVKYNPFEVQVACRQADAFQRLISASADRDKTMLPLSKISYGIAANELRKHPNDSYAHELYGKNVLLLHMAGQPQNPQEALDHFNRAQELAPRFKPVMVRRYVTARGIGDGREMDRAKADIVELDSHWRKL